MEAKTVTKGRLNNDKANGKGKVTLECAAALQFMRGWRWEGSMNCKRVGGRLWGHVCREWWESFAHMCVYAWQRRWLSGGNVRRLRECSMLMCKAHLFLQWPKLFFFVSVELAKISSRFVVFEEYIMHCKGFVRSSTTFV